MWTEDLFSTILDQLIKPPTRSIIWRRSYDMFHHEAWTSLFQIPSSAIRNQLLQRLNKNNLNYTVQKPNDFICFFFLIRQLSGLNGSTDKDELIESLIDVCPTSAEFFRSYCLHVIHYEENAGEDTEYNI